MNKHQFLFFLNTTDSAKATLALIAGDKVLRKTLKVDKNLSEQLPQALSQILKIGKTTIVQLRGIIVVTGPGSFVGVRVGVAWANALAYALKLSITGIKVIDVPENLSKLSLLKLSSLKIVLPYYDSEPHITKTKRKI